MLGSSPRAWGTRRHRQYQNRRPRFIPTGVGNTCCPSGTGKKRPVHPHGRGEHYSTEFITMRLSGSSPRAWGTPVGSVAGGVLGRFIPTGVGNTQELMLGDWGRDGSSPRAWGTPLGKPCGIGRGRFIPTGVGNTGLFPGCPPGGPVHPHGRGEHSSAAMLSRCRPGSSPRAWGTLLVFLLRRKTIRFIPTGVGNTSS